MRKLSRRTILRSGSTALLLPLLEANLAPAFAAPRAVPKRLVFLPMGYGVNTTNWLPSTKQIGTDYDLPPLLAPFADLKADFSVVQNLTNRIIPSPHHGSMLFLSCNKKAVSCDQVAAELLGQDTRHSSLAIGTSRNTRADGHGGYTSWTREGKPVGLYRKLPDLYGALFGTGGGAAEMKARLARKQSSLDLLMGNAKRLNHMVSAADRDRVDEYFTTIRNIEKRLEKAQAWADTPFPKAPFPAPRAKEANEVELVFDLMHLAIQSDSTRVMSYMIPTTAILSSLRIGLNPHRMSHRAAGELDPQSPHQRRDLETSKQVARFLTKLKETKEYDGSSLLDNSLVAYGSALRSGHNKNNGPMLLAGHGGGGLKQGQNVVYPANKTPLANLWLSMLRHVGVEQDKFANSNRVLSELGFS